MRTKAYQNYFESEIRETTPLKLVEMLYRGALDAVAAARRCLRTGDIRGRSQAINKAMAIVTELSLSLNAAAAAELGRNLADLYAYVEKRLIQANFEQHDQPLAEVESLLSTLLEGWTACLSSEPSSKAIETSPAAERYERISCAC